MKLHPKLKSEFINVPDRGFGKSKFYKPWWEWSTFIANSWQPNVSTNMAQNFTRSYKNFYIVAVDIRGYGDSEGPKVGGENHVNYSFRAMGNDFKFIMEKLGFDKFYVAGHDRGLG